MSVVTPHSFANRYLQLCDASEWEQIYTYYLLELALVEYRMIKYKASEIAAAAVHLAIKLSPQRANHSAEERWVRFLGVLYARFTSADKYVTKCATATSVKWEEKLRMVQYAQYGDRWHQFLMAVRVK